MAKPSAKRNMIETITFDESEKTIILGCYHSDQEGIFVYNVTDPRLSGVEQVTDHIRLAPDVGVDVDDHGKPPTRRESSAAAAVTEARRASSIRNGVPWRGPAAERAGETVCTPNGCRCCRFIASS